MKKQKKKTSRATKDNSISVTVCGITVPVPKELGYQPTSKAEVLNDIGAMVRAPDPSIPLDNQFQATAKADSSESTADIAALRSALCKIATNAWRAENKMKDKDTGVIRDDFKRIYRHIESIFDGLTEAGIEKIDETGKPYNSGMILKVVSFEPTAGLTREIIKETISPTVKWHGKLIQTGEVIVGTPQT